HPIAPSLALRRAYGMGELRATTAIGLLHLNPNLDFPPLLLSDGREAMAGSAQHRCICSFPSVGRLDQTKVRNGATLALHIDSDERLSWVELGPKSITAESLLKAHLRHSHTHEQMAQNAPTAAVREHSLDCLM